MGTGEVEAAARALGVVGASRDDAYLGLRAVMCSRREDLAIFDAAFSEVFAGAGAGRDAPPFEMPPGVELALPRVADPGSRAVAGARALRRAPGRVERRRAADRQGLLPSTPTRSARGCAPSWRSSPATGRRAARGGCAPRGCAGVRPDLQRTLRASLRWGGEPLERRWREPADKPRKLVLVCDVSGSMAPYARVLLQYLHAAVATHRRVEVFAFGTRLTRLTRELGVRDPDLALARAAEAVDDWSGGTRIGHCLGVLNREYGRRLGRGAVVVILSDGWDRGEPELLADEMARLRRSAHRVVWLNPLKAAPDYEPLARGMAAALPHTDHFLAGNSLASLAELASILEDTR